jgi:hypothetical protein
VEQGPTSAPLLLPAPPYLRDLAEAARELARVSPSGGARAQRGLIPPDRVALLEEEQARRVRLRLRLRLRLRVRAGGSVLRARKTFVPRCSRSTFNRRPERRGAPRAAPRLAHPTAAPLPCSLTRAHSPLTHARAPFGTFLRRRST